MKSYYNIKFCPLWKDTNRTVKVCDLPAESILLYDGVDDGIFMQVTYQTAVPLIGYVVKTLLEPIEYELPINIVKIPYQTATLQDAAQYMIWMGNLQFNMCGELCICYVFNLALDELLTRWKAKPLSKFQQVFGTGKARGTNANELADMADMYPSEVISITSFNNLPLTARRVRTWLDAGWYSVIGVKIEKQKGRLRPAGILHWVVIVQCESWGINQGWVTVYNPFSNSLEKYSWNEFSVSCGTPMGVFIKPYRTGLT